MQDKSYVSMEEKVCPVCGIKHNHDCGILLDRRLIESMDKTTVTGYGLCEEHDKQYKEGYRFLVEIDPSKSRVGGPKINMEDAHRTGVIAAVKYNVLTDLGINVGSSTFVFVDPEVIAYLKSIPVAEPEESVDTEKDKEI